MRVALVILLLLTMAGCNWLSEDFDVVTADQLDKLKCEWQNPKETAWFYIGSEGGFHRFIHQDASGNRYYQINETEFTIDNPRLVSSNKANWVVMPWGPAHEECQE